MGNVTNVIIVHINIILSGFIIIIYYYNIYLYCNISQLGNLWEIAIYLLSVRLMPISCLIMQEKSFLKLRHTVKNS